MRAIICAGLLVVALCAFSGAAEPIRYDGHRVLRISTETPAQKHAVSILKNLKRLHLDFWRETRTEVDIRIPPRSYPEVLSILSRAGALSLTDSHSVSLMVEDVQKLIDNERTLLEGSDLNDFFSNYQSYDSVNAWLVNMTAAYPTLVTPFVIGTSYEGRQINGLRIAGPKGGQKYGMFFNGGQHAREWITVSTLCYIINQFLTKYGSDPTVTAMLDSTTFHLVPIANPDGYVYTWTTDRMWRKTRSPNKGSSCVGTDPNRNWDNHWCEQGGSSDPCDDEYCGAAAFSEIEIQNLAAYVKNNSASLQGYIDFHSYSQIWMSPWGWTTDPTPDAAAQQKVGQAAVAAIKGSTGKEYQEGPIAQILYAASGSSADYTYQQCGIVYSYGVELRDEGTFGFVLPANQINPQGQEVFAAITVMQQQVVGQLEAAEALAAMQQDVSIA